MSQINILVNYYNFDGDWARPYLAVYLKNRPHVLILPLAYREIQATDNASWLKIYGCGGEKYDNIVSPFLSYGYRQEDIEWLNPYDETDHLRQIQNAEMLFFTGGMPEKALARLEELGLTEAVLRFDGIVAGASAGAMLQLETYHITPDDDYDAYGLWQGLGLVKGLDLEVHYLDTELQNRCALRAAREHGLPVYKMWHEGGLLVADGKVTAMGRVDCVKR